MLNATPTEQPQEQREKQRKNRSINMRLSDEEYEIWASRSEQAHLTMSEYFRQAALFGKQQFLVIDIDAQVLRDAVKQASAMGNNLNQIAHAANKNGKTDERKIVQACTNTYAQCQTVKEEVKALQKLIREAGGGNVDC